MNSKTGDRIAPRRGARRSSRRSRTLALRGALELQLGRAPRARAVAYRTSGHARPRRRQRRRGVPRGSPGRPTQISGGPACSGGRRSILARLHRLLEHPRELLRHDRADLARSRDRPAVPRRVPAITVRDMVRVQRALADALGVRRVRMAIGGSLGGMQVLEWALCYPAELVDSAVFIASTARHSAWCIGLSEAQRQAIYADPRWSGGARTSPPTRPRRASRPRAMMAMLSYRSQPSFEQRFARRPQTEDVYAVESYLRYQGQLLVDRFDPATHVTLTRAMDTHDVSRARGDFDDVLRSMRQRTLVVSIDSDVLYWPWEQREVAALAPNARLAVLDSPHGHDAFLIDVDQLSDMVVEFRGERRRRDPAAAEGGAPIDRAPGRSTACRSSCWVRGRSAPSSSSSFTRRRPSSSSTTRRCCGWSGSPTGSTRSWTRTGSISTRWRELLAAAPSTGLVDAERAPAARPDRGLPADPRRPHRRGGHGGRLRAGVPARDRRRRREQAAPRGAAAPPRAAPRGAPPPRRQYRHDTAVGASLPVIGTLRRLVRSGDRVRSIVGSLSGTLGYLCTELGRGVPLSLAVRWAIGLGYAEEDPRDDLSGRDAAQQALILARETGALLALEDVEVEPLVPAAALAPGPAEALIAGLRAYDELLAARWSASARRGRCSAISPACRPVRTAG